MSAELLTDASRALDANGNPMSGAKWRFYASGTSTPLEVYSNASLTTKLGAVVTADSAGRFVPIYFNNNLSYRGRLEAADGSLIPRMDIDPINTSGSGSNISVLGYNQAAVRSILATTDDLQTILDNLPADGTDEVRIAWDTGAGVFFGGALYTFIKDTLSYTTDEMTDLLASASASTDFPQAQGIAPDTATIAAMMANFAAPTGSGLIGTRRASLLTAAEYRTLAAKVNDRFDLRDVAGYDLTGNNDNASVVQSAVNDAVSEKQKLHAPGGDILIGSSIQVPTGFSMQGEGRSAKGPASRFIFADDASFLMGDGAGDYEEGWLFRDIVVGNIQPAVPGSGSWDAVDADPIFLMNGAAQLDLQNVLFYGATRGVNMAGGSGIGRLNMESCGGQVFVYGVNIELCADVPKFSNVHWWPFFSDTKPVNDFSCANLDAFYLKRVDTPIFSNVTAIAARSGFRFANNAHGKTTKALISNAGLDFSTQNIWFDDTSDGAYAFFTNLAMQANNSDGVVANINGVADRCNVLMEGNNCFLAAQNADFGGASGSAVRIEGTSNEARFGGGLFVHNYGTASANTDACFAVDTDSRLYIDTPPRIDDPGLGATASGSGRIVGLPVGYTPGVTPETGTFTNVTATGQFIDSGYVVNGGASLLLTNVGTAAGYIDVTLPTTMPLTATFTAIDITNSDIFTCVSLPGTPGKVRIIRPSPGGDVGVTGHTINLTFSYLREVA